MNNDLTLADLNKALNASLGNGLSDLERITNWLLSPPTDKPIDQQSDAEKLVNYLSQPIDRSKPTF
jgi:hypothetical protein